MEDNTIIRRRIIILVKKKVFVVLRYMVTIVSAKLIGGVPWFAKSDFL